MTIKFLTAKIGKMFNIQNISIGNLFYLLNIYWKFDV